MLIIALTILQGFLFCLAQIFLKLGLNGHNFEWTTRSVFSLLCNGWIIASGLSTLGGTLLWCMILKRYPLSMAYPLTSIGYVFGILAGMIVFNESVTAYRWIGLLLIISGCYFITK